MNIIVVTSSLEYGGAQKQSIMDANLLSSLHNVLLISFSSGPLISLINEHVTLITIEKNNYLSRYKELIRIIRRNKSGVIHASLFASMIISALTALFSPIKVLWHFHSHEHDIPFFNRFLYKFLGRSSLVNKLIFVNKELMDIMCTRFHFPTKKSIVLYNTSAFNYIPQTEDKKLVSECTFGFVGRLVELKRASLLVDLAKYLESQEFFDYKILIVGDGPERSSLLKLVTENHFEKKFIFTGFQKNIELFYDQIDVFVLPSREECLSIATIDAGIKGLPSVVFNVGGNNEIVEDGKTGFVVNSIQEFFERVLLLAVDVPLRQKVGRNAGEYCNEKFGYNRHCNELNKLYNDLGYSLNLDF